MSETDEKNHIVVYLGQISAMLALIGFSVKKHPIFPITLKNFTGNNLNIDFDMVENFDDEKKAITFPGGTKIFQVKGKKLLKFQLGDYLTTLPFSEVISVIKQETNEVLWENHGLKKQKK